MSATARQIEFTEEDLAGSKGGAYAELDVPADYEMVLVSTEDYDKTAEKKSKGWLFKYDVETPSGTTVPFNVYLSFGKNARWKMVEVLEAHDLDLSEGVQGVDPASIEGDIVGGHIDYPRDDEGEPTSNYREVQTVFSLAEEPEEDEEAPAEASDEGDEVEVI